MLSEKQIEEIASNILVNDVIDYVKINKKDFQKFVEEKRNKQHKQNDEELKIIEDIINKGKIEVKL